MDRNDKTDALLLNLEFSLLKIESALQEMQKDGLGVPPENIPYLLELISTLSKAIGSMTHGS